MALSKRFEEDVKRAVPPAKSQRQLAADMNVSQGTVGNMFMGRIPSDEILDRFADAVGQDRQAWRRRAKVYREEAHLRALGYLPDEAVEEILKIMQHAEREQQAKGRPK